MTVIWAVSAACSDGAVDQYSAADPPETVSVFIPDLSDAGSRGAELFAANCATCHGPHAGGSSQGPPLVHSIYEPGHHADFSFHRAVSQGTPQHHWGFGDMAPVAGLTPEEVDLVICYVRELQYADGIFSDPANLAVCET